MSKGYSIQDLADIVEIEGLGYSISDYVNPDKIEDASLKKLWKKAQDALRAVQDFLDDWDSMKELVEDDDDDDA
jgi:hypothetical protein